MGRMPFWAVFFGAVVVLNAGAFAAYSLVRDDSSVADNSNAELIKTLRFDGLEALKKDQYRLAKTKFMAAAQLSGGDVELAELIKIASQMDHAMRGSTPTAVTGTAAGAPVAAAPTVAEPVPETTVAAPEPVEKPAVIAKAEPVLKPAPTKTITPKRVYKSQRKRITRRAKPAAPVVKEKTTGTLLVTSEPSGLMVEVDGERIDITPIHREVTAGAHRVAIFKKDRRIFDRRVNVAPGTLFSLDPDLRAKLKELQPKPIKKPEPVVAARPAEQPKPIAAEKSQPPKEKISPKPAKPVAFGELHIISPNVYGSVFINGQDRGYPPVVLKKIPVGKVIIEIRVDGAVRRTKAVRVDKDRRRKVMFR